MKAIYFIEGYNSNNEYYSSVYPTREKAENFARRMLQNGGSAFITEFRASKFILID